MPLRNSVPVIVFFLVLAVCSYSLYIWKGKSITEDGALAIQSLRLGQITISDAAFSCTQQNVPTVALNWNAGDTGATTYIVERRYPWTNEYEEVGRTANTSFADLTYAPGYDLGVWGYRITARNDSGSRISDERQVSITLCSIASSDTVPTTSPVTALDISATEKKVLTSVKKSSNRVTTTKSPGTVRTNARVKTNPAKPIANTIPPPTTVISPIVIPPDSFQVLIPTSTSTTALIPEPAPAPAPEPAPAPTPVSEPIPTPVPATTITLTTNSIVTSTPTTTPIPPANTVVTTTTTVIIAPVETQSLTAKVAPSMQWGAYVDSSGLPAFETLVGKPVKIQAVFAGWGHSYDFPTYMSDAVKAAGKTLLIFWENSNGYEANFNQPDYNADSITSGSWDSYIRSFARSAKTYGSPVILSPFHEMNGNWSAWAGTLNGNTPAKLIAAWKHMHNLFKAEGVTNVKWAFAPNSTSWPNTAANDLTMYYPGDAYVDYVGADGFNFNNADGWESFASIFNAALTKLEAYNKPIYIFSMASAQGPQKAAWITDAFSVQIPKHPKIAGWIWFNTNKEKDWRVNSDAASLSAFKAILP